jgi:hypothetical protein
VRLSALNGEEINSYFFNYNSLQMKAGNKSPKALKASKTQKPKVFTFENLSRFITLIDFLNKAMEFLKIFLF